MLVHNSTEFCLSRVDRKFHRTVFMLLDVIVCSVLIILLTQLYRLNQSLYWQTSCFEQHTCVFSTGFKFTTIYWLISLRIIYFTLRLWRKKNNFKFELLTGQYFFIYNRPNNDEMFRCNMILLFYCYLLTRVLNKCNMFLKKLVTLQ